MGKKKCVITAMALAAAVLCTNSTIKSQASALVANNNNQNLFVQINEEEVPTAANNLPVAVDNSLYEYFPPIINQGSVESCSSWAVTYYQASSEFNRVYGLDGSLSENQLSPMWTYNFTNGGKNAGTYFTDVVKVLQDVGAVSMEMVPVDTETGEMEIGNLNADKEVFKIASEKRISGYNRISNGEANRLDNTTPITGPNSEVLNEAKAALNEGHILSASTPGNKWIYETIEQNPEVPANDAYVGDSIVTRCDKPGYAGHRIAIVGYNDEIWCDINNNNLVDEGEKGAFKIANSRGTTYGNGGFMWISYDSLNYISSVYSNAQIDLGYEDREPSLIDIVSLCVDTEKDASEYFVEFDAETSNVAGMSVVLTATNKADNNLLPYRAVPFKKAVEIGLGELSFDGSKDVTSASFAISMDNLIKDVNPENVDNYDWILCVGNFAKKDVPITYSNFRIVDKEGNVVYTGDTESVTIESGDKYIKFK